MTVAAIDREMGSSEFTEWIAFDTIEPIDSNRRAEFAAGIIASTIGNCHLKRGAQPLRPMDFVADWDGTRRQAQSSDEMLTIAKALAQSGLGTIVTGG